MIESKINQLDLPDKKILLRADLNVPIKQGKIANDYRLKALLPTLDLIKNKGGKIILISHLGRPTKPDPALSTKQLLPWFEKQGYRFDFASTIEEADKKIKNGNNHILLENLRFFPGEKGKDKEFAKKLANLADFYVNDAFGSMHREDASIILVPTYFSNKTKTIGLLVQQELEKLSTLLHNPQKPFALIIGGGKVQDKHRLLFHLIEKIDMLFLCPAIVFSFLKAQGEQVGKSLVDETAIDRCKEILNSAQQNNVTVLFPIDYQIAMNSFDGPLSYVPANEIPPNGVGITIGPQTVDLFTKELKKAKTILYNGLMGDLDRPETVQGACNLFAEIAKLGAQTIIAGGDSVAAAQFCNVIENIEWCSTGGGATIAYLSGQPLPGLVALKKNV